MRKIVITTVLCLAACIAFGQKKAVNTAKNEIKATTPNIAEAREAIKGALKNPETAEQVETWFVAGMVEHKQFDMERTKELIGQQPNNQVMYAALEAILPYFEKTIALDQLPDAKGNVKPKYTKEIKTVLKGNRPYYTNAGLFYNDNKDYKKAYANFKLFGDIRKLEILKDEKWPVEPTDTSELQIRFYAGLMASAIPDHKAAIDIFNEIKAITYVDNIIYKENDIYQRLCSEYQLLKDTANFEKTVKEGFAKFPEEDFYLLNLINQSISKGKTNEAITYLEAAIAKTPNNAQFYDVLGQVYESEKKYDDAIKTLKKSLELEPDNVDVLNHIGRVYYNLGVETRGIADNEKNEKLSKDLDKKSLDYFKEAMPFFEKIHAANAKDKSAVFALRSIYYTLTRLDPKFYGEQYEKMDALFNSLDK
jgi:tetratricopeptide (TPR) repeat protein